jgi:hypothetical protein
LLTFKQRVARSQVANNHQETIMPGRAPIEPRRIRKIRGSFSWIEHRFVHQGFLRELSRDELLLYYFLVTVGDRHGVSYYDYEKICQLLKINVEAYIQARNGLVARQLIAYADGVFQVLPLPEREKGMPARPSPSPLRQPARSDSDFQSLRMSKTSSSPARGIKEQTKPATIPARFILNTGRAFACTTLICPNINAPARTTMTKDRREENLSYLQLVIIRQLYEEHAAKAGRDNLSYLDFWERLVEEEVLAKKERAVQKRVQLARFPVIKTLDQFDFEHPERIPQKLVRSLFDPNFVKNKYNSGGDEKISQTPTPHRR